MNDVIDVRPDLQEQLREANRFADLMVKRGLLALVLRELIALRQPGPDEFAEWQEFAKENVTAGGGLVGSVIPQDFMDMATRRADEVISTLLSDATR